MRVYLVETIVEGKFPRLSAFPPRHRFLYAGGTTKVAYWTSKQEAEDFARYLPNAVVFAADRLPRGKIVWSEHSDYSEERKLP